MPPRFSYWTIIAGGLPTAFRATEREELLPTFTRLKEKQPDAEMKWFARGKLWSSPEEAQSQRDRRFDSVEGKNRHRDQKRSGGQAGAGESRGRDWRPGGDHRDPRQQFKDAKKARNQRIKAEKFARKPRRDDVPRERPHGDPLTPERRPRPQGPRSSGAGASRNGWTPKPRGGSEGAWRPSAPAHDRNSGRPPDRDRREPDWQNRGPKPHRPTGPQGSRSDWRSAGPRENSRRETTPRERPHGDPLAPERRPRPQGSRQGDAGTDRKKWTDKPGGGKAEGWRPRPPARDRNSGRSDRRESEWQNRGSKPHAPAGPQGARRDWTAKPPREKPHGDKLARPSGPSGDRDRGAPRGPRHDSRGSQPPRSDARGAYRGQGHGDNSWKPKPPRDDRDRDAGGRGGRPFEPRGFDRDRARGSANQEPTSPPRPRGPNREPRRSDAPAPDAPPRPSEPVISPPGPPERGRLNRNKRTR
jgi:hypothetical protein